MDLLRIPSFELDELMKIGGGGLCDVSNEWGLGRDVNTTSLASHPLPTDELLALDSPTAVLETLDTFNMQPIIALPSAVENGTFFLPSSSTESGEGSTGLAAAQHADRSALYVPTTAAPTQKTEAQKNRIRAKNRRAQEKYRQKKKTAQKQTEDALDAATADLERLQLENERLSLETKLKEKVLDVKDTSFKLLETAKSQEKGLMAPPHISTLRALQGVAPTHPTCADDTAMAHLDEVTDQKGQCGRHFEDADGQTEVVSLNERTCPMAHLSHSEIVARKRNPPEEMTEKYGQVYHRVKEALQAYDAAYSTTTSISTYSPRDKKHATSMLQEALWEAGCMCFEAAVMQPTAMQRLLAASVGDAAEAPDSEAEALRWRGIVEDLDLTLSQRQRMKPLREAFLGRIERVTAQRRAALDGLQQTTDKVRDPDALASGSGVNFRALQFATANWLQLNEASQDLAAGLHDEHVACMELVAKAFGGVLTPVQKARAIVASYPNFPDVLAIATAALSGLDALTFHDKNTFEKSSKLL